MEKEKKTEEVVVETVSKGEYDTLVKEYNRIVAAYNKAMNILASNYIEKTSQAIFAEVDKEIK